jgi:hypothetical protein
MVTLDKAKLEKNVKKFEEVNGKYKIFTDDLMDFLGQDFFLAPASPMRDMNNAFPGGLLDHTIKVAKYAVYLNNSLPESMRESIDSILKVSFLSEIGKTHLFTPCQSEWHIKNQGKYFEYNEELVSMKVGERSAYYALSNGVKLTDDEYQAILNHDKGEEDKQVRWYTSKLGQLLKQATDLAILEEKETLKNGK